MLNALTAFLALGVALGYFTIAVLVLPRIQLDEQSPRFVTAFRVGGIAFFVGCGLTHSHIAVHAITGDDDAALHEVLFHLMQVFGVWVFIVVALRIVDVRITRRRTPQELEAARLEQEVLELSRSNTDLERFAHVVSHDLQEPLRTVTGFADLVAGRYAADLDEKGRDSLAFIRDGCERMSVMLDGVLHYSRVAGAGLTREPVDMAQVARDVEGNLARAIADSGATLEIGPLPRVEGDRVQLTQLLQNLVANALKFSGDRPPRVEVSADEHPDGFSFTVRDHGIGVDPGDAERIFDMFVRAEGVAGSQSGSGIGLAVCRRIVERHGGTIGVEPTPGGGSTFRFSLPPLLRHPPLGGAPAVPVGAAG